MNKQRRAKLAGIHARLTALSKEIEAIRDEEQEAYDNMPESLQDGNLGSDMQDAITELEEAADEIEGVLEHLQTAMDD